MTAVNVRHEAGDRYRIAVREHRLVVDQPLEAGGGDAGPTPTELFVASLAACVAFYAGRFLRRHGVAEGELAVACEFSMSTDPPSRVESIVMRLEVPTHLNEEERAGVLRATERCAVRNSIRWAPKIAILLAVPEPVA